MAEQPLRLCDRAGHRRALMSALLWAVSTYLHSDLEPVASEW